MRSSTSVGSVASTSFEKSSDSSSKGTDGRGRVPHRQVAAAEQRPGTMRLQLQAVAEPGTAGELVLYLPRHAGAEASWPPARW
jgi:hypothetical protein